MPSRNRTVLGISPGCRYLALAVFHGTDLRDWRIRSLEGHFETERVFAAIRTVARYIAMHGPAVLAIKVIHPSRTSAHLRELVARIEAFATAKDLPVKRYTIRELETFYEPRHRINKVRLAELVARTYPILLPELARERRNKNRYYDRMFDAVATGALCFHQLDQQHQSYVTKPPQDPRH